MGKVYLAIQSYPLITCTWSTRPATPGKQLTTETIIIAAILASTVIHSESSGMVTNFFTRLPESESMSMIVNRAVYHICTILLSTPLTQHFACFMCREDCDLSVFTLILWSNSKGSLESLLHAVSGHAGMLCHAVSGVWTLDAALKRTILFTQLLWCKQ